MPGAIGLTGGDGHITGLVDDLAVDGIAVVHIAAALTCDSAHVNTTGGQRHGIGGVTGDGAVLGIAVDNGRGGGVADDRTGIGTGSGGVDDTQIRVIHECPGQRHHRG